MTLHIEHAQTRKDCVRDNQQVICPNASLLGFSTIRAKPGRWVMYEVDNHHWNGRVICRVTCEGKVYLEVAQLAVDLSFAYIRWILPEQVRNVRPNPPRHVLHWITADSWEAGKVHADLNYGVSDMRDQIEASDQLTRSAKVDAQSRGLL